ncbi:MAG: sigma-54-dependent Fis family transcriptional regulator [Deltaproteobacteria bacterium]|nr:sigma-54-dependent Fis family transcriptional regulator [Deltaproteobacteria bacterium]
MANARILVVDDDPNSSEPVALALTDSGYEVETRSSAEAALAYVRDNDVDLVVSDIHMPGMDGIELCRAFAAERADMPVIIVTGHSSFQTAVDALRAGASDYLTKPVDLAMLEQRVERTLQYARLEIEVKRLRRQVAGSADQGIIGESEPMKEVNALIERVAATGVSVLLTGESGTGKEVAARAIHDLSPRKDGAFVAVNCAALPENLLESELFGHERGAFTDAKRARRGLFLEADGGTLLLDEIGEMPITMQAKLLRALQERRVRPVGSDRDHPFDTRVIAATNRDLEESIQEGSFREDLYYRLNVVNISLPPLRQRGNDIMLLAQRFIQDFATRHGVGVKGIAPDAAQCLLRYDWPGNVRELMNAIERGVALARFDTLQVVDLPERIRDYTPQRLSFETNSPDDFVTLEELERRYILRCLEAHGGNKSAAGRVLGVDRKTLHRKLARWGMQGEESDDE